LGVESPFDGFGFGISLLDVGFDMLTQGFFISACFKSLASGLFKGSAGGFVIGYDLDFCHVQAKQKEQQDAPPLPF
jgi:hypothetical protein